jgi:uncharacterized OsmC-like protein
LYAPDGRTANRLHGETSYNPPSAIEASTRTSEVMHMLPDDVKTVLERNAKAVSLRPSVGQGTAVTRLRLAEGLKCEIEDGPWKLAAGMTEKYGGDNAAPNPGVLGRSALASCLALSYAMWAAWMNVPLASLEIEIQADYDVRGELGVSPDVRPGYTAIRYIVTVGSSAPEAEVMRMLDASDRCCSWLDNIVHPVAVRREVRILAAERG